MRVTVDKSAGFCWGVVQTIDKVEETLSRAGDRNICVLGQIIHNPREIERLEKKGLKTVTRDQLKKHTGTNSTVIIRAHGEPPETYLNAKKCGVELIDATCPLVKNLQKRIKIRFEEGYQIVIFGKKEHAEVIGLRGVCNDECIVIKSVDEALEKVDTSKKTILFSQTTMNRHVFDQIKNALEEKFSMLGNIKNLAEVFIAKDTICKYVKNREDDLVKFAKENEIILFVAGRKSSNGKILFDVCKKINKNTFLIEGIPEIDYTVLSNAKSIGITGATSTPQWYMDLVRKEIERHFGISS